MTQHQDEPLLGLLAIGVLSALAALALIAALALAAHTRRHGLPHHGRHRRTHVAMVEDRRAERAIEAAVPEPPPDEPREVSIEGHGGPRGRAIRRGRAALGSTSPRMLNTIGYDGPISTECEDAGMDRLVGGSRGAGFRPPARLRPTGRGLRRGLQRRALSWASRPSAPKRRTSTSGSPAVIEAMPVPLGGMPAET